MLLTNFGIYCAPIKRKSQKWRFEIYKRDQKERKVTKYCHHEEISNVLIKNVLVVYESHNLFDFFIEKKIWKEKRKSLQESSKEVFANDISSFAIMNFIKLWRKKVPNNKSTLWDCVPSSQKPPPEVYKINLENLHCDLTLIFICSFLNSRKCHGALQINLISPLTKDKQKSFSYFLLSSAGSPKTFQLSLFTLNRETPKKVTTSTLLSFQHMNK